jgi:hypothetical protein
MSMNAELNEMCRLARASAGALWRWEREIEALQIIDSINLPAVYIRQANKEAHMIEAKRIAPIYQSYEHGAITRGFSPKTTQLTKVYEPWANHFKFAHVTTMPIRLQNKILGALSLYFSDPSDVDESDTTLFALILARVSLDQSLLGLSISTVLEPAD